MTFLKRIAAYFFNNRLLIFLLLLLGIFGAIAVIWAGEREREASVMVTESRLSVRTQLNVDALTRRINELKSEALFLTKAPPVQGIVRASLNNGYDTLDQSSLDLWNHRLETIFSAFVETHPETTQLRFIGVANNGRELIRINHVGEKIIVVPTNELQEKGGRGFFNDIMKLRVGQTYASDIDLNQDDGKVQFPYVPTLRVAAPVFGPRGLFGMVVINIDARSLLSPLQSNLSRGFISYMTNNRGDFILHPDENKTFGFERNQPWQWKDEFQQVSPLSHHSSPNFRDYVSLTGDVIHVIAKNIALDNDNANRHLTVIMAVSEATFVNAAKKARHDMLLFIGIAGLLLLAIAYFYLRQRRRVNEQHARISAIVESSSDAIIGKTLAGIVTSWNKGAEQMFGYTEQEAIGKSLASLIVPVEAGNEEIDILKRVGSGEILSSFATVRHRRDGTSIDVSVTVSPIRDASGQIIGISKTARDISHQKVIEAHLHDLNASLEKQIDERTAQIEQFSALQRAILTHASYAIIASDTNGLITLFNPAAQRLLGYSEEEMIGKFTPAAFHDPAEVQARAIEFSKELDETIAPGFEVFVAKARRNLPNEHEWIYVRKDKTRFPVSLSVSALRNDVGTITGFLGIASDISERAEDRRQLISARDQLFNAAKAAELGIWTWNITDNTLQWNERMYELYSIPTNCASSIEYYDLWCSALHPEDAEQTVAMLQSAIAGTCIYDTTFRILRPDGEVRFIHATGIVERDHAGNAVKMHGGNLDVTEQHKLEETLRAASLAAARTSQAKSEFVANMSHELRTPMNAVLGITQLLLNASPRDDQRKYLDMVRIAGESLLTILNDILDFSKIESGKMELSPTSFRLSNVLNAVATIMSVNVGNKDIELTLRVDPDVPPIFIGDAMRLQQILINLVGNAIKFTEHGDVDVFIDVVSRHENDIVLRFRIRDTGIGMDAAQQSRLFSAFTQADSSMTRRFGGTGLGLTISKRLVQLMGGSIQVQSEVRKGSEFSVVIPLKITTEKIDPRYQSDEMQNLRLLIIDDHLVSLDSLSKIVQSLHWHADVATSGEQGINLFRHAYANQQSYDAVLLDWNMPETGGVTTLQAIRTLLPDLPIILMVSSFGSMTMSKNHSDHQEIFLIKPITASSLFDILFTVLGRRELTNSNSEKIDFISAALSLVGINILLVEDNEMNQVVVKGILENTSANLDIADNGQEAIDVLRASTKHYDIILMDVQMPIMDGFTATRLIRKELHLSIPIIAMTAGVTELEQSQCREAGMTDFISKPVNQQQFLETILRLLPSYQNTTAINDSSSAIKLEDKTRNNDELDFDVKYLLMAAEKKLAYKMMLINSVRNICEQDTASLVEVHNAVKDGRYKHSASLLHTMRGEIGNLGGHRFAKISVDLERVILKADLTQFDILFKQAEDALKATLFAAHTWLDSQPICIEQENSTIDNVQINEMFTLLAGKNIKACETYSSIRPGLITLIGIESLLPLDKAMDKLDFKEATHQFSLIVKTKLNDQSISII